MIQSLGQRELKHLLSRVFKPGRYTGGEYGQIIKEQAILRIVLSYPDIYEIGMSNYAIRLLYTLLNNIDHIACERVFSPDLDLEDELRKRNLPLFSLEQKIPLHEFDIMAFSIGHELLGTNMLNILDLGQIPVLRKDRNETHPIVIAGGPAVSNPAPFDDFVDCTFIGESEDFFLQLMPGIAGVKRRGGRRKDVLNELLKHPSIYSPLLPDKKVKKSIWMDFVNFPLAPVFPVPNVRTIQNIGVVEIMRGCPNKCRFCHASIFYRPFRFKEPARILEEVKNNIFSCGYREVALSSLSSGDYSGLNELFPVINSLFRNLGVSFSLPSLRIDSLALSLLTEISKVRKSGLTFAVETPLGEWQSAVNKCVPIDKTIAILKEAKEKGWRLAKLYFMIGLPLGIADQSGEITDYISQLQSETGMNFNVNISTFIPKPHTPFQWSPQISEDEATTQIMNIKNGCKRKNVKVGYHSPFQSLLEGLFARGDSRVSSLLYSAFKMGARYDAWEDKINRDVWVSVFNEAPWDVGASVQSPREKEAILPWDNIHIGVSKKYLLDERARAETGKLSGACTPDCQEPCGSCGKKITVRNSVNLKGVLSQHPVEYFKEDQARTRLLVSFSKKENAVYLSHLDILLIIERSLLRAGYFTCFSRGFNPKPIIEFANPIPLGMISEDEAMTVEVHNFDSIENFSSRLTSALPAGIAVNRVKVLLSKESNRKRLSLASQFWGADYRISAEENPERVFSLFHKINKLADPKNEEESYLDNFFSALDAYFLAGESLILRFKNIEKKGITVMNFIKKLCDDDEELFLDLDITRLKTLAVDKRKEEVEPQSFFSLLE